MKGPEKRGQTPGRTSGVFAFLWERKIWWLWPLAVLVALIAIIYALAHLSAADSEMYPTTTRQGPAYVTRS